MTEDLVKAIVELEEEEALRITKMKPGNGEEPIKIMEDSRKAMELECTPF